MVPAPELGRPVGSRDQDRRPPPLALALRLPQGSLNSGCRYSSSALTSASAGTPGGWRCEAPKVSSASACRLTAPARPTLTSTWFLCWSLPLPPPVAGGSEAAVPVGRVRVALITRSFGEVGQRRKLRGPSPSEPQRLPGVLGLAEAVGRAVAAAVRFLGRWPAMPLKPTWTTSSPLPFIPAPTLIGDPAAPSSAASLGQPADLSSHGIQANGDRDGPQMAAYTPRQTVAP